MNGVWRRWDRAVLTVLLIGATAYLRTVGADASAKPRKERSFSGRVYDALFADPPGALTGEVDMDFTRMNMVMRSARVFELMSNPKPYLGKRLRFEGRFSSQTNRVTGVRHFACLLSDPGGCCVQGFVEFAPNTNAVGKAVRWPESYPMEGETFSVQGVGALTQGEDSHFFLKDAEIAVSMR